MVSRQLDMEPGDARVREDGTGEPASNALSPEEMETDEPAVEIVVKWGDRVDDSILRVEHLTPPSVSYVGENIRGRAAFVMSRDVLGASSVPLITATDDGAVTIAVPDEASGERTRDGNTATLDALAEADTADDSPVEPGPRRLALEPTDTVMLRYRGLLFTVKWVKAGKRIGQPLGTVDRRTWAFVGVTLAAFVAAVGTLRAQPPSAPERIRSIPTLRIGVDLPRVVQLEPGDAPTPPEFDPWLENGRHPPRDVWLRRNVRPDLQEPTRNAQQQSPQPVQREDGTQQKAKSDPDVTCVRPAHNKGMPSSPPTFRPMAPMTVLKSPDWYVDTAALPLDPVSFGSFDRCLLSGSFSPGSFSPGTKCLVSKRNPVFRRDSPFSTSSTTSALRWQFGPMMRVGAFDTRSPAIRSMRSRIERVAAGLRSCWSPFSRIVFPNVEGRVVVELEISRGGKIASARLLSSSLHAPAVEECMLEELHGWTIPTTTPSSGPTRLRFPLHFEAPNEGMPFSRIRARKSCCGDLEASQ